MRRSIRLEVIATTLAVSLSAVAVHAAPIVGTGTVSCQLTGKAKLKPGLIFGGTEPVAIKFIGKMLSCTGGTGDGANVVGGKLKATGTAPTNDCGELGSSGVPPLTATVKWKTAKGTPKLEATTIAISGGTITVSGTITVDINGSATGGSFSGNTLDATAVTDEDAAAFAGACATAKGLKKFNFTGVNGTSSLALN